MRFVGKEPETWNTEPATWILKQNKISSMNKYYLIIISFGILMGCSQSGTNDTGTAATETHINTLTPAEVEAGWELLFDGNSTDLWRGYNKETFPEQGWKVEDGNLIVEKAMKEGTGGRHYNHP